MPLLHRCDQTNDAWAILPSGQRLGTNKPWLTAVSGSLGRQCEKSSAVLQFSRNTEAVRRRNLAHSAWYFHYSIVDRGRHTFARSCDRCWSYPRCLCYWWVARLITRLGVLIEKRITVDGAVRLSLVICPFVVQGKWQVLLGT